MACLSKHNKKGYRIHGRFKARAGPRAGELIEGSNFLGKCTLAAAKTQLRETEKWEAGVKLGQHVCESGSRGA